MLVILGLTISAHAQIQWAKQLTPETGWVATGNQLFWTTDAGGTWKDITPPHAPKISTPLRGISAVFFLDSSTGWVVMHSYDEKLNTGTNQIFIASTNDAGANWSYRRVSSPEMNRYNTEGSTGLDGNAWLQFTDAQHGIMNLGLNTGSAFQAGVVSVATSDGGRTWADTDPAGDAVSGELLFRTQNDGWIAGDGLFVTRDGGKTWRETVPPAPEKLAKETTIIYSLPIFPDKDHGFLAVEYDGLAGAEAVILFSSHDGGRTWKQDKVLSSAELAKLLIQPLKNFIAVNSEWRTLAMEDHKLVLSSLSAASPLASASVDVNLTYLYSVTFLDGFHGWALMGVQGDGPDQLLSTPDGGVRWTIITPPPIKGNIVGHPPRLKTGPAIWKKPADLLKTPSPLGSLQRKPLSAVFPRTMASSAKRNIEILDRLDRRFPDEETPGGPVN